jgi:hypothetical protein
MACGSEGLSGANQGQRAPTVPELLKRQLREITLLIFDLMNEILNATICRLSLEDE